jgi:hypothetical protein
VIPLTAWRITSFSAIDPHDITLSLYHVYLTTTIQLNFAIFMACVTFLRPFLESTATGGMATTVNSTKTFSSFFDARPLSYHKSTNAESSYAMQNLSEVGLNEIQNPSLRKSDSTTNASHTNAPSIDNYETNLASHSNMNPYDDLGPLRPDQVMSFSHVSNPPVEETQAHLGHSRERGISRTMEWGIQSELKRNSEVK